MSVCLKAEYLINYLEELTYMSKVYFFSLNKLKKTVASKVTLGTPWTPLPLSTFTALCSLTSAPLASCPTLEYSPTLWQRCSCSGC